MVSVVDAIVKDFLFRDEAGFCIGEWMPSMALTKTKPLKFPKRPCLTRLPRRKVPIGLQTSMSPFVAS